MKKLYTLTLVLFGMVASYAQVIYSENFGTPSGTPSNPPASTYTGYQNAAPIVYTGTATIRTTAASAGYTGASGAGNAYFGAGHVFMVEGINTSAFSTENLELSFGQLQEQNITNPSALDFTVEVSTNGTAWTLLPYTRNVNTGWDYITIESGIPSTTNLRIRFTRTSTSQYRIDDIKVSSVAAACTLELGIETTECTNSTLGTNDTYTVTIPFTGGNNGTYTVAVTSGTGTVGGDSPTSMAEGNIVISGVTENTNITVTVSATISGQSCVVTRDVIGGSCEPVNGLPYSESFNYTVGSNLGDSQMWQAANSGDAAVIVADNLTYTGVQSVGNAVSISGAGSESYTPHTETATGTIYHSFLMKVTDMTNVTTDGSETAFAIMGGTAASEYNVRLWYKKVGEQYQLGLGAGTAATAYTTSSFDVNQTVLVIMGFNYTNNTLSAWINPTLSTLTAGTAPTLTETLTTLPDDYVFAGFILRQDDNAKTPTITVDELRMVTNISELVLSTVGFDAISGLKMFPNPVSGTVLNIVTDANAAKTVVVYDMVGKQVVNTVTENGTVNVSDLSAGIYIVNITEEGKTATRKLVVK